MFKSNLSKILSIALVADIAAILWLYTIKPAHEEATSLQISDVKDWTVRLKNDPSFMKIVKDAMKDDFISKGEYYKMLDYIVDNNKKEEDIKKSSYLKTIKENIKK